MSRNQFNVFNQFNKVAIIKTNFKALNNALLNN